MAANNPTPSPSTFVPTVASWLADVQARFAANRYGRLDDADFRAVFEGLAQVFTDWRSLNVKKVRGATYPVPYTDNLSLVPADYRILGMQAVAVNGVDSSTGATGVTALPVYFTLIRHTAGTVQALVDGEANTVLTVRAVWVQTSGSDTDKVASFPVFVEEDHPYDQGDVFQYTFSGGETRLFEVRHDLTAFQNPLPTGLDADPNYKSFAPLAAGNEEVERVAEQVAQLQEASAGACVWSGPNLLYAGRSLDAALVALPAYGRLTISGSVDPCTFDHTVKEGAVVQAADAFFPLGGHLLSLSGGVRLIAPFVIGGRVRSSWSGNTQGSQYAPVWEGGELYFDAQIDAPAGTILDFSGTVANHRPNTTASPWCTGTGTIRLQPGFRLMPGQERAADANTKLQYQFVRTVNGQLPDNSGDIAVAGTGTGGTPFVAIAANQFGTHPAFNSQADVNAYLLSQAPGTGGGNLFPADFSLNF